METLPTYGTELLNLVNGGASESSIQRFFENSPHLLTGSHFVLADALITQLRLGADFRPDFAYIEPQSGPTYLHLIEIENPSLQLFNSHDEFTQEFNHAYQQLVDWAYWVERNQSMMIDVFRPLYEKGGHRGSPFLTVMGRLIAGRREQLSNVMRKERFESKSGRLLTVRTYDGLAENLDYWWGNERRPRLSPKTYCYRGRDFHEKESGAGQ
ncbi:MAG TPA: Shedu anti-phage system protein SduA domain-containing protein [Pyrinomonadaceae bacterium]|nr:Shedu anti-phage system protein SduA domain-containing protein [Pyrinomonadaceae bacterium]